MSSVYGLEEAAFASHLLLNFIFPNPKVLLPQTGDQFPSRVGDGCVDEDQIDIDFDRRIPVLRRTLLSTNDSRAQEGESEEDDGQEKARFIPKVGHWKSLNLHRPRTPVRRFS